MTDRFVRVAADSTGKRIHNAPVTESSASDPTTGGDAVDVFEQIVRLSPNGDGMRLLLQLLMDIKRELVRLNTILADEFRMNDVPTVRDENIFNRARG
jgi:hypothetical protein